MALTPNFSCSQDSGLPSVINIVDTSSGSDSAISARRVYLLQSDGTYLVTAGTTTNYILWSYASSTDSFDVLSQDAALSIKVEWVNINGTVLYFKTIAFCFTAYSETFYYGLTQGEVPITNPNVALSTNYYQNKMLLKVFIDSANQAVSFASNIYAAQVALDSAAFLIANANFNF